MIASFLLSAALLATAIAAGDQPPAAPDLQAYREAKATAGRDAEAQVKLALWCEEHGLTAERIKHLTLATLIEPSHAAARGLLGLIFFQGKWQRPDDVAWIHQEIYNNNQVKDGLRPQMYKYHLDTEPWLFTINRQGKIAARIEGAFSAAELEKAVNAATKG